jgi:hypothetical protein
MKRFDVAYRDAFRDYIHEPSEATLQTAYELGRDAVERELSVLDLAIAHHDALASVLSIEPEGEEPDRIVHAARDFFLESISAFEMVQRGFWEARDAALLERRHAEMLRQLSHFLADASLALDASSSLDEMLRLVAEQARELIPADCCLVETGSAENARVRAASYPEDDLRWMAFVRWADLSALGGVAHSAGRPVRMDAKEIATRVQVVGSGSPDLVLHGWLCTSLVALDGSVIGSMHLISESDRGFTALHEAVVQHLAQMSAAAIERARLYGGRPSSQE